MRSIRDFRQMYDLFATVTSENKLPWWILRDHENFDEDRVRNRKVKDWKF